MKERLLHILDDTACLTRKQMKDYLAGTMLPEEVHAAEAHIASCPLCSMALEGFEEHSEEALAAIASLNSGFLKTHFDAITPKIHLNSLSPATTVTNTHNRKKKAKTVSLSRLAAVAALALLVVGAFWLYKLNLRQKATALVARRDLVQAPASAPAAAPPATVRIADSILPQPTTASRTNGPALDEPAPIIKEQPKAATAKRETPAAMAAGNIDGEEKIAGTAASLSKAAPAPVTGLPASRANAYQSPPVDAGQQVVVTTKPAAAAKPSAQPDGIEPKSAELSSAFRRDAKAKSGSSRSGRTIAVNEPAANEKADQLRQGDENFGAGKYSAALRNYRAEMASGDAARKSMASVMAARCYINLGQKEKAATLLENVISNGPGPQRRQARRLLRELRRDANE